MTGKNAKVTYLDSTVGPTMADLLVAYLDQLGIEYVFGVPGGAIEPLYNALARSERRGGVRAVVARHETGAAFMADGYARNSGKLGVCCSTTGPGATNMITGVASAYENNVPMLVITAQTAIATFGKGAIQDSSCTGVNTVGLYTHCTRYNTLISHINQFEHKLAAAIMSAMGSPAGPAHISVPRDVMAMPTLDERVNYQLNTLLDRPALIALKWSMTPWVTMPVTCCSRQWLTEFDTVCGKVILSPVSGVMNSPLCWKIFSIWKLLPVSRIKFVAR